MESQPIWSRVISGHLIDVLTGDPASLCLWNLFLSDLCMMPDFDDLFLAVLGFAA
jgi:hypothetical protein